MTKEKVARIAKKLGCELVIERNYIELVAPKGKVISDDVMHYSGFEVGLYTKKQIWERLDYELSLIRDCEGSEFCNCK
jgi:hypothetical protein